jgi:deoxyhypusine synthase
VPNANYVAFEEFMMPILETMHDEQDASEKLPDKDDRVVWTPSSMIDRLGKEIDNEESVYYWCHKNKIPVYCPAITDGSVGDMLYFHSWKRSGFVLDITKDIRGINDLAVKSKASGMVIVGGGIVKHHICNANLMRNGANFSVFINTSHAFDGSDGGAPPDEAISWGKIRLDATPVKVCGDATIVFPLVVSQTFAKGGPKTPLRTKEQRVAEEGKAAAEEGK